MSVSEHANYLLNEYGRLQFDYAAYCKPDGESLRNEARNNLEEYIADLEKKVDSAVKEDEMSELKPCPFCGGGAAYTQILGNYKRPHEVYCFTCDGGIKEGRSKDGVIHNWNTRPIEDALNARIAELKAFINQLIELGEWGVTGMKIATSFSGGEIHNLAERRQNEWLTLVKDWKEREE